MNTPSVLKRSFKGIKESLKSLDFQSGKPRDFTLQRFFFPGDDHTS